MNRTFILLGAIVFLLSCSSCKQNAGELVSESPDGKKQLEVIGTKSSYFSPLSVLLYVRSSSRKDSLWLELEQEEINQNTCEVDWLNNNTFTVTLWHRDMEKRVLKVQVESGGISLAQ